MERARLTSLYSHSESEECVKQLLELEEEIKDDDLREQVTFHPSSFTYFSLLLFCLLTVCCLYTDLYSALRHCVFHRKRPRESQENVQQVLPTKQYETVTRFFLFFFLKNFIVCFNRLLGPGAEKYDVTTFRCFEHHSQIDRSRP